MVSDSADNKTQQQTDIQELINQLYDELVTLTMSLKGQLSPAQKTNIVNLFRMQKILQTELGGDFSLTKMSSPTAQDEEIFHAQTLQYARDLAETHRQKKRQQRLLEVTAQQLIRAEKLATVGQVAMAIAHEINDMLAPLPIYAKLIDEEKIDEVSEAPQLSEQITDITDRASTMLNHLMEATRSETLVPVPVNMVKVIHNILSLMTPQIKMNRIIIKHDYLDQIPLVMGNPNQLEQATTNIIINAFEAMTQGGDFTIKATTDTLMDGREYIFIQLIDTGIGIPPESLDLLFEPFYTTKPTRAGAGLGLFVSQLIIERHNGSIEVESELGKGTSFTIKLPTLKSTLNVTI